MEILCIGNELLIGKVTNTNASWLATKSTFLGMVVKRITAVGDDLEEIGTVLKESLRRHTHFIIVTGGLGPTFDDMTLEGIAKALDRKWEPNKEAVEMVKRKFNSFLEEGQLEKLEMTPPRLKMAKLPEGSTPLHNPVGTAPGVLMQVDSTTLIALPGVPSEMEAIFYESVAPMLKKAAGKSAFFEASLFAREIGESKVAPLIDKVMTNNPEVYIKSHPKLTRNHKSLLELHFSTTATEAKTANNRLSKAMTQLSASVRESGGKVKTART
jgi:nicotinamide-nucleotide amidase